jgi:hypothetical protein
MRKSQKIMEAYNQLNENNEVLELVKKTVSECVTRAANDIDDKVGTVLEEANISSALLISEGIAMDFEDNVDKFIIDNIVKQYSEEFKKTIDDEEEETEETEETVEIDDDKGLDEE